MDQAARGLCLEDLALTEEHPRLGRTHLQARSWLPVRVDAGAEVVPGPDLRIGDRLPQAAGGGTDVDLEDLLHGALQSLLELAEGRGPRLGVLAHPPVVDEADRDRVQEVELLAASAEQLVEQAPPGWIGQRLEHRVHASIIRDHIVTCQRWRRRS